MVNYNFRAEKRLIPSAGIADQVFDILEYESFRVINRALKRFKTCIVKVFQTGRKGSDFGVEFQPEKGVERSLSL